VTRQIRLTHQIHELGGEAAFEVRARAARLEAEGRPVLHLEMGEPDFPTPPHIVQAAMRALRDGATKYAPPAGLPELREAIACFARGRGLSAEGGNVLVTSGAKPMLFYALGALTEPGDEVLIPDPGFPITESVVRFALGRPVGYRVDPARRPALEVDDIRRRLSKRTRILVINSPHNPTGVTLDSRTAAALAELAQRHDLAVVCDEIYSQLLFEGSHHSVAALPGMAERTVVIDGFSKAYAMAGWRLGYGILPIHLTRHIERFIVNTTSCAPPFVQHAALAALTGPQACVQEMLDEYRARRNFVVERLNQIEGVSCPAPQGTFFAFPHIGGALHRLDLATEEFTELLLEASGLACLPGTAFGQGGSEHVRLSFATSRATLERALAVLQEFVHTPGPRRWGGRPTSVS
jgi:aspartate aminotransferase